MQGKRAGKAVVIIDVQQGMFAPPLRPHGGEAMVGRLAALLARARNAGAPVFFVRHRGAEPAHPLHPEGQGFAFHPGLAPEHGEPVTVKSRSSAFHGTALDEQLRAAGIGHLVVGGMQTEYCVDSSVRSAFERGYDVTLVADGHTTFDTATLTGRQIIAHHNRTLGGSFAMLGLAGEIAWS